MSSLQDSIKAIRQWQRHWLLRQYGDNGHVLPENLVLNEHINRLIVAANPEPSAETLAELDKFERFVLGHDLADRLEVHTAIDSPGFHLSEDDMAIIKRALRR